MVEKLTGVATNQKVGGSNPSGATMTSQSARFALRIFYFK